ncbi:MAG: hypothetical protein IT334_11355 [Thermomicrobiales bacterium]|nr:hypothetical protein [Thermomicrobiales bacterium]
MASGTLLFLSGVNMQPSAIRDLWPAARFQARVRIEADRAELNPFFANAFSADDGKATIWGIAVACPEEIEGVRRDGQTDAGDAVSLTLVELPLLAGDPEAVLAAALYWELPPAYTARLREAAGVAAPEAEGGWESPLLEAEPPATGI